MWARNSTSTFSIMTEQFQFRKIIANHQRVVIKVVMNYHQTLIKFCRETSYCMTTSTCAPTVISTFCVVVALILGLASTPSEQFS